MIDVSKPTSPAKPDGTADWKNVWWRIFNPIDLLMKRLPCESPELCIENAHCGNCQAWDELQEQREHDHRAFFFATERMSPYLTHFMRMVRLFPDSLASILKPIFDRLFAQAWQKMQPVIAAVVAEEVQRQTSLQGRLAANLIASPGGAGPSLRRLITDAMLPEIEDYLIDVVQGVLDAQATPLDNPEADLAPEQADPSLSRGDDS